LICSLRLHIEDSGYESCSLRRSFLRLRRTSTHFMMRDATAWDCALKVPEKHGERTLIVVCERIAALAVAESAACDPDRRLSTA